MSDQTKLPGGLSLDDWPCRLKSIIGCACWINYKTATTDYWPLGRPIAGLYSQWRGLRTKLHMSHAASRTRPGFEVRPVTSSRPSPSTRRRSSRVWQRHVSRVITRRTCVLNARRTGLTIKILTYGRNIWIR